MADVPLPAPACIVTTLGSHRPQHFMLSTSRGVALMEKPIGSTLNLFADDQMHAHAAAVTAAARDCRTCKWFHQPGDSPIPGCISHGRCYDADRYEPLPPVRLWRTAP